MSEVQTVESPASTIEKEVAAETRMQRPEVYYDVARKDYWILNSRCGWITVNETGLKRQLKESGFSDKRREGETLSDLERCLNKIQRHFDVDYAGPLAGYQKGMRDMCGQRILVTSSPNLIEPKEGAFPLIAKLLEGRFGSEQLPYLYGWLKVSCESFREGKPRPGQVLVFAGEADSGKSLLQNLITIMFGGRAAKPYRYMSDGTDFNGDLFGAEHLMIEDEVPSATIVARRALGAKIKEFTVNKVQSCHAKNRQAISLEPLWRVTISVNDEPENLGILPPLDESLADKIILLKVAKAEMPMPTQSNAQRVAFWSALVAELPAFLYFLANWEIPADLKSERFGITHFHHPELLESLQELAPETRLLSMLDDWFRTECADKEFMGTAERLTSILFTSLLRGFEAKKLLSWSNATGTYLGRLAKKHSDRVTYTRTATERIWRITRPKDVPESGTSGAEGAGVMQTPPQAPAGSIFNKPNALGEETGALPAVEMTP